MDKSVNTWRAEGRQLRNPTRNNLSNLILLGYQGPWLGLETLQAERNFSVLAVDRDNVYVDLLTNFQDLTRVAYLCP